MPICGHTPPRQTTKALSGPCYLRRQRATERGGSAVLSVQPQARPQQAKPGREPESESSSVRFDVGTRRAERRRDWSRFNSNRRPATASLVARLRDRRPTGGCQSNSLALDEHERDRDEQWCAR